MSLLPFVGIFLLALMSHFFLFFIPLTFWNWVAISIVVQAHLSWGFINRKLFETQQEVNRENLEKMKAILDEAKTSGGPRGGEQGTIEEI